MSGFSYCSKLNIIYYRGAKADAPAGGGVSSANDLAKWLKFQVSVKILILHAIYGTLDVLGEHCSGKFNNLGFTIFRVKIHVFERHPI